MPFIIVLVFVATALLVAFLLYIIVPRKTVLKERLEGLEQRPVEAAFEEPLTAWQKFVGRLGAGVPLRIQDYGKYMRFLIAAGIRKEKFALFMGSKIVLAILLPAIYLIFFGMTPGQDYTTKVLVSVVLGIFGFLLPSYWLTARLKNRQLQIFFDLPDVLDLMTVCVEAGLSIDASMVAITQQESFQKSPLVKEMKITLAETRAGKARIEALRNMGERSMVDDLKAFTTVLIQTERLGTSLAQALRVYSDSFRTIRMQRAEEAAAKTTIKLLFPLVMFIFPALFVVMLLPAIIRMQKFMSGM